MEEKYGEVEEMNVCDNLGDHLVGNVYVKVRVCVGLNTNFLLFLYYSTCSKINCCCIMRINY